MADSPCEMLAQGIQALAPQVSERGQPRVELRQRLGPDPVQAALGVRADDHETRISQDPEMLGHRRLAECELPDQLAHRALAVAQQVEDATAGRLGQHPVHSAEYT
jgi:hypothetical protein